ncbi:uncharacterized protein LOC122712675 [Apis laboriosa]|uniref:uncharacterized protein LOC122712675 n=1 Tax=Apis laboriosa TaxID=183418 RepID=UPI001CC37290|nr:uncharacterized protein LOC122712675 [Apis laboriosa]
MNSSIRQYPRFLRSLQPGSGFIASSLLGRGILLVDRGRSSFGLPSKLVHGGNNVSSVSKALEIFLANAPFLRVDCEVSAGPTTDEESTLASVTFRGCDLPSSFSRGEEEGRAMVESLLDKVPVDTTDSGSLDRAMDFCNTNRSLF